MPESVKDRPTLAHEHVLLLTQSERYFYDWLAVLEPLKSLPSDLRKMAEQANRFGAKHLGLEDPLLKASAATNIGRKRGVGDAETARALLEAPADPSQHALAGFEDAGPRQRVRSSGNLERDLPQAGDGRGIPNDHLGRGIPWDGGLGGRNARSVWRIATVPYAGPHFATFPPELVAKCVQAGTSARACGQCGAPWERIIRRDKHPTRDVEAQHTLEASRTGRDDGHVGGPGGKVDTVRADGWKPGCECGADAVPCVVLDPFGGTGTTAAVAVGLGRRAIYIDANPDYPEHARQRIGPLLVDG